MANYKIGAVALLGAALISVGAGCGGTDPKEAETPANATTVTNGAAPAGGTETKATEGGDVAAGKAFYAGSCEGCHPAGGTAAGAGPKLQGAGLTAAAIETQIKTPKNAMPANLASGEDLTNVTAYILSLK